MTTALIVPLIIGCAVVLAAVLCVVKARQFPIAIRILAGLFFALFGLFCAFGFAAALEPGDDRLIWQVGYALTFLACLFAIGRLFLVASNSGND